MKLLSARKSIHFFILLFTQLELLELGRDRDMILSSMNGPAKK